MDGGGGGRRGLREKGDRCGPTWNHWSGVPLASNRGTVASAWPPLCPVSCCGKMGVIPVLEVRKNNGMN